MITSEAYTADTRWDRVFSPRWQQTKGQILAECRPTGNDKWRLLMQRRTQKRNLTPTRLNLRTTSACTHWFILFGASVPIDEQKARRISLQPNAQCGVGLSRGCEHARHLPLAELSSALLLVPFCWHIHARTACPPSSLINVFDSFYSTHIKNIVTAVINL